MARVNKVVALIMAVCFLCTSINCNLAFGQEPNSASTSDTLAVPSGLSDIAGIEHKDMARIKIALEAQLRSSDYTQLLLSGTRTFTEKTIYQPADIQFFFAEKKLVSNFGTIVMARIKDQYGVRTYHVVFKYNGTSTGRDYDIVNILSSKQYGAIMNFGDGVPAMNPEDAIAVEAEMAHQRGADTVIAYAHDNALAKEPINGLFNYKQVVISLMSSLNINVANPLGLKPIEDRDFFLIPLTKEIEAMRANLPKAMIVDAHGKMHEVLYSAHSSNNAVHVFVSEDDFERLTNNDYRGRKMETASAIIVRDMVRHEIGAICGLPVLRVENNGAVVVNTLDERWQETSSGKIYKEDALELSIANLDHVKGRDYAYATPELMPALIDVIAEGFSPNAGAFTGQTNIPHLKEIGIESSLVGHSETRYRRVVEYEKDNDGKWHKTGKVTIQQGDSNKVINQKLHLANKENFQTILCCGEPRDVRDERDPFRFVLDQIKEALKGLNEEEILKTVKAIAYEPIWAINTGLTATPEDAQAMCSAIRSYLAKTYSHELASKMRILYGGSVKPNNAEELINQRDIDGFLIGGASLKTSDFIDSISATVNRLGQKAGRTPIVAANWKAETGEKREPFELFITKLALANLSNIEVVMALPSTLLSGAAQAAMVSPAKMLADKRSKLPAREGVLQSLDPVTQSAWINLVGAFARIKPQHLRELFANDPGRARRLSKYFKSGNGGIYVDYSKQRVTDDIMALLFELARQVGLEDSIKKMFAGEKINETENRAVLHTALRMPRGSTLMVDGVNVVEQVHRVLDQMKEFSEEVNSGKWTGYTGKRITDVVNIGIGGSDLGPVMVTEALKPYATGNVNVHFVSNVDGTDITEKVFNKLNPETTLFIIASKTFTTQETITNAESAKNWFLENGGNKEAMNKHFVALSTNKKAVNEFGITDPANMFEFWDWVGGRYSLWSAIGLSIATYVGFDNFQELLAGAHDMDEHFKDTQLEDNIPVIMALLNIWNTNFLGTQTQAILPYDQYMHRLPAYLQQGWMESNGKTTDRNGNEVAYRTCPVVWGEAGTNGQHSFYQKIHQGGDIIPADFIGVSNTQNPLGDHHDKFLANLFAQTRALAFGKTREEVEAEKKTEESVVPHKVFAGNIPTNTILLNKLDPRSLGAMIAMYEHQIAASGFILNIFSFDQWGVELGKKEAGPINDDLAGRKTGAYDNSTSELLRQHRINTSTEHYNSLAVGVPDVVQMPISQAELNTKRAFGTNGIRTDDLYEDGQRRLAAGTAEVLAEQWKREHPGEELPYLMVGFDPRPQGENGFEPGEMGEAKAMAETLAAYGFKVLFVPKPVAAPFMIAMTGKGIHPRNIYAAVMRTASHNEVVDPKSGKLISGVKVFMNNAPAPDEVTGLISKRVNNKNMAATAPALDFDSAVRDGRIVFVAEGSEDDPDEIEFKRLNNVFNPSALGAMFRGAMPNLKIALNTMFGGMSRFALRIFKTMGFTEGPMFRAFNTTFMNDASVKDHVTGMVAYKDKNTGAEKQARFAPDPTRPWMRGAEYDAFVSEDPANTVALLVDGDADRLVAELEKEIIPNDIGMLAAYYLAKYKGQKGRIVRTVPTTGGLDALAKALELGNVDVTPVGSKWFAGPNKHYSGTFDDILVAVEESGHIGFRYKGQLFFDHSIALALLMMEMTAETGKSWQELSDEMWAFIKEKTGQERIATVRDGIGKDEGAEDYYGLVARLGNPKEDAFRKEFAAEFEKELAAVGLPWKVNDFDITDAGGAQFKFEGGRRLFPRKSGTDGSVRLYVEVMETERAQVPTLVKVMRKVMDQFVALEKAAKEETAALAATAPAMVEVGANDLLAGIPRAIEALKDRDLKGQNVLVRIVANVKFDKNGVPDDMARIENARPIVEFLLARGANVTLIAHNGNLETKAGKTKDSRQSLKPLEQIFKGFFPKTNVTFHAGSIDDSGLHLTKGQIQPGINILENVRFSKYERRKDGADKPGIERFARDMASLSDGIYIADAAADMDSPGVSTEGVLEHMNEIYVGPAQSDEFVELDKILKEGIDVFILGGSKLESKLPLIRHLLTVLSPDGFMLIGSALSAELNKNPELLRELRGGKEGRILTAVDYGVDPEDGGLYDIGEKTRQIYQAAIDKLGANAKILVNGTMGFMEHKDKSGALTGLYQKGTEDVFGAVERSTNRGAKARFAGGDGRSAAIKYGLDKAPNTKLLTSGGVALKILAGNKLAGVEAMRKAIAAKQAQAAMSAEEREISSMISVANEAGLQIPTHPNDRYNLLVASEFFANGDLAKHQALYGDRFDLDRVSGTSPAQFVDNIIVKAAGKNSKTVALVTDELPAGQLKRLTNLGIRFVRVSASELRDAKVNNDPNRAKFQVDTYATMLLLRQIDDKTSVDSAIYRLLSFYLKSHFSLADKVAVDDYIKAIVSNDVMNLIKGLLKYKPAQPYAVPAYETVAQTLISA